ncbi:MAG TPA: DUF962 domain-containing protein [Oceanospirillales bacterium]|nr:DUF962 domain-containing protein [Oceanospirillales bacterium]
MKPTNSSLERSSPSLNDLLDEYALSHQNKANKKIHYFCVPIIFWSITAMLWMVAIPMVANLAIVMTVLVSIYYISKDLKIALQMIAFSLLCLLLNGLMQKQGLPLLSIAVIAFIVAWILQFIGHHIEGKKPSFFKDLQFLLVGPAWIVRELFTPSKN